MPDPVRSSSRRNLRPMVDAAVEYLAACEEYNAHYDGIATGAPWGERFDRASDALRDAGLPLDEDDARMVAQFAPLLDVAEAPKAERTHRIVNEPMDSPHGLPPSAQQ